MIESVREIEMFNYVLKIVCISVLFSLFLSKEYVVTTLLYVGISLFGYLVFEIKYAMAYVDRCIANDKLTLDKTILSNIIISALYGFVIGIIIFDTANNIR